MKSKIVKKLTINLIISIFINITCLVSLLYIGLKEKEMHVHFDQKPITKKGKGDLSNSKCLQAYSDLSFRELVLLLSNKQSVEDGYAKRDLALACLTSFHYFHLEKALSAQQLSKRTFLFSKKGQQCEICLFPGLNDYHFESIIHYAYTEKWPLTSQGLHSLMHKWKKPRDASLEQAFLLTTEFHLIRNLMNQENSLLEDSLLLDLISELPWEFIETFTKSQMEKQEITQARRSHFLLEALSLGSTLSGQILLQTDFLYVVKKLDDRWLAYLLSKLEIKTDDVEQLCFELLKSSRSDDIWKAAAKKLYQFAGEQMPEPYDHQKALRRFVLSDELPDKWQKKQNHPNDNLSSVIWPVEKAKVSVYVVKTGDSLWKIARRYKVDLDELVKLNHLESFRIYPGREILIPNKSMVNKK
jgi:hypothetical protein